MDSTETTVQIPFNITRLHWGDFKKIRGLQKNAGAMSEADLDWFVGFVDRVCEGQADDVPMLDLMRLVMEAMNREMSARMNGANSKN